MIYEILSARKRARLARARCAPKVHIYLGKTFAAYAEQNQSSYVSVINNDAAFTKILRDRFVISYYSKTK